MATGSLITPDIVITAGHCVFDIDHDTKKSLGRAGEIKACIGYHGKDLVHDKDDQWRYAIQVSTTAKWVNSASSSRDVAFIRLAAPFEGDIRPFTFNGTPTTQPDVNIGVVGFPGDDDGRTISSVSLMEDTSEVSYTTLIEALGNPNPFKEVTAPLAPPPFGPLGDIIAAVGGVAIGAIGRANETTESDIGNSGLPAMGPRRSERAVLADSTLQIVLGDAESST